MTAGSQRFLHTYSASLRKTSTAHTCTHVDLPWARSLCLPGSYIHVHCSSRPEDPLPGVDLRLPDLLPSGWSWDAALVSRQPVEAMYETPTLATDWQQCACTTHFEMTVVFLFLGDADMMTVSVDKFSLS